MSAPKPGSVAKCRHCGERIVLVNWALGVEWAHQPEGAAFQDSMSRWCRATTAEPAGASS